MKKIKKIACLLMATVTVLACSGFISAYAASECLHANGVTIQGHYLYTTTVTCGFVCPKSHNYEQCTEVRYINRLDMMCKDCGKKIGSKEGYHIVSHSNPHCTWEDVTK